MSGTEADKVRVGTGILVNWKTLTMYMSVPDFNHDRIRM